MPNGQAGRILINMQRAVWFPTFVAFAVLSSCGSSDSTPPPAPATIAATVHEVPTGPPISGVRARWDGREAISDATGAFQFANGPIGPATIHLEEGAHEPEIVTVTLRSGINRFSFGMRRAGMQSSGDVTHQNGTRQ
jgi:hypothetical protein